MIGAPHRGRVNSTLASRFHTLYRFSTFLFGAPRFISATPNATTQDAQSGASVTAARSSQQLTSCLVTCSKTIKKLF